MCRATAYKLRATAYSLQPTTYNLHPRAIPTRYKVTMLQCYVTISQYYRVTRVTSIGVRRPCVPSGHVHLHVLCMCMCARKRALDRADEYEIAKSITLTSYKLQATNYKLRVTSYKQRATSDPCAELQNTKALLRRPPSAASKISGLVD